MFCFLEISPAAQMFPKETGAAKAVFRYDPTCEQKNRTDRSLSDFFVFIEAFLCSRGGSIIALGGGLHELHDAFDGLAQLHKAFHVRVLHP